MADGIEILKKTGAGKYPATIYKFKSMNDTHTNNIYIYIYFFYFFLFQLFENGKMFKGCF